MSLTDCFKTVTLILLALLMSEVVAEIDVLCYKLWHKQHYPSLVAHLVHIFIGINER